MTMPTSNTPTPDAATLNADPRELDKFGELAHRWWDPNGEFKPLHDLNPLRVDWIVRLAGGLAGKTVLDVGCGGGILAEALAREGAAVTGIDLARKSLRVADLHGLESGVAVRYEEIAVEALAAREPARFDVVCCMEMLEHVPDPAAVVTACAQLVKPGGIVFFSTLNRTPKSWLLAIVGAEYLLRMVPRGTHDWARFIRPAELVAAARAAQLEPFEITGLHYNPVSRRYTLGGAPDVNYLVACRPQ